MASSQANLRPLRVLCIDGGGIRGFSSLLILRKLMEGIADTGNAAGGSALRPCDYFDFICGTSTGGLIAILLGRLKLTIKQAIDTYLKLSKDVFAYDRSTSVFGSPFRASKGGEGRFDAEGLKRAIQATLKAYGFDEELRMFDPPLDGPSNQGHQCRAAVVAVFADRINNAQPKLFTTYIKHDECKVWEAARATSAAPTFFDPIEIDLIRYVDAGLGYNNSAEVALDEVQRFSPNREIGVFLSLGTGKESVVSLRRGPSWVGFRNQAELVNALSKLTTSATRVHDQLYRRFQRLDENHEMIYFRFNVDQGLENIGLQEWTKFSELAGCTEAYLLSAETNAARLKCVARIAKFSATAKPYEMSARVFRAVHEGDMDTDFHSMAYWYRETLAESHFPTSVAVGQEFQSGRIIPVGDEILSLRRICNILIRGQADDIPQGTYRVKWMLWFWAGNTLNSTSRGLPSCFTPTANIANTVTERQFQSRDSNGQSADNTSGFFFPWNLTLSIGRAKSPRDFLHTSVQRYRGHIVPPALLREGFQEQILDAGLWGSLQNTGWTELSGITVEVGSDRHLAFIISVPFEQKWIGGFAFGGVRLEPVIG